MAWKRRAVQVRYTPPRQEPVRMNGLFSYTKENMFKKFIQQRLEALTKRYFRKKDIKLVVVTGSVGKTSTKMAIATVLGEKYAVRVNAGNHNTHMSAPLAMLGIEYPENVHSVSAWIAVWRAAHIRLRQDDDVEVVVQELGTDHPGDIAHFGKYLKPDIAVVTAVSPEHMEFFEGLDAVAQEELGVASYSKLTIINRDDIDQKYAKYANTHEIDTYGLKEGAEYRMVLEPSSPLEGRIGQLIAPEWDKLPVNLQMVGDQGVKAATAAAVVGAKLGLTSQQVAVGMSKIRPVKGRMAVLRGLNDSTLIDDTYNASPLAVHAALDTLYAIEAPQRIAILGSMNELGATSQQAHDEVGKYCDPTKLEWVVTIGEEAEKYLAPAAAEKGCQVKSFQSPYQAGGFVHSVLKQNAVVLAKGSQNGVFAEEALKVLLHATEEEGSLVRQSEYWLGVKREQFSPDLTESTADAYAKTK